MDTESQKMLSDILSKEPAALTEHEIAVLRARASYLTPDQKAAYAAVLTSEDETPADESTANTESDSPETAEAPRRRKAQ